MHDSATDALWTVLKSDAYTSEQKSIAFSRLGSNDQRSWKELLAFVKEGNLENQFSREIRAA